MAFDALAAEGLLRKSRGRRTEVLARRGWVVEVTMQPDAVSAYEAAARAHPAVTGLEQRNAAGTVLALVTVLSGSLAGAAATAESLGIGWPVTGRSAREA